MDKNHYTGVLTLEEVPDTVLKNWIDDLWIVHSKGYTPYYVVDGQQRLTTAILLVQAITEAIPAAAKLNYSTADEIRKKYIYDSRDGGISRSYLFGYEKDNPSYEFLKTKILLGQQDNATPVHETIYTHNLQFAKKFFSDRLGALEYSVIEALYRKLTQNFLFNIYSISDDVDVFVAFETMNNRGKRLSHLELLKNRLIYLSTRFVADVHEKEKLRQAVNESWKSMYHFLGRNKENPLDDDVFLQNHFLLYFGDRLQKQGIPLQSMRVRFRRPFGRVLPGSYYETALLEQIFVSRSLEGEEAERDELPYQPMTLPQVYSYVQSLKLSVETWYYLLNPEDSAFSDEEKMWLGRLNRLSILPVGPLILAFYQQEQQSKLRVRFLKALERFIFVLSLSKFGVYSSEFEMPRIWGLALGLSKGGDCEKVIKELEQFTDDYLSRKETVDSIVTELRASGFYGWDTVRYFMYEYEMELQSRSKTYRDKLDWDTLVRAPLGRLPNEDSRDYYTVEHIYPQKALRACWADKFKKYSEKERSRLRHSLGNLAPLSQPKNSSFQNQCFEDKKGTPLSMIGYRYGSYTENEVAMYAEWTAREILERGLKLIDFMEKRWRIRFGDRKCHARLLNIEFVADKEGIIL